MILRILLSAATVSVAAHSAAAADMTAEQQAFYDGTVVPIVTDPMVIEAILAHNAVTADYSADDIAEFDRQWAAQVGRSESPLVDSVLDTPVSDLLRETVSEAQGIITELFVMDAQGLNVAASSATSDYWQGDEAKHAETYGAGAGAFHVSEVEFDESSQVYAMQISFTVVDPATDAPIGAITVGVNAAALE
ncbi:hypothetical protein [Pseudoroseicyclus tamaricis]|uniref:Uncharacterized protein n=1 Tax=Pseudoroseicyclus tamaricis TaxID=2705421 RepID=A0A6B2JT70_9RHOB|nr:hypothetical protein [Pseudoroseicyclus tamaricis]NDV01438.1 hypothetical protein [Pseudoroseicyclus tamaricis]